jgi:hypothetical protein
MAALPFTTVTNESELNQDLAAIAGGTENYTIAFGSGFTLDTDLLAVSLGAGSSLPLQGAGNTIDGADSYRGRSAFLSSRALAAVLAMAASSLAPPALAANYNVSNASQLQNAINSAAAGDTIIFTSNITLSSNLPHVTKSITIAGGYFTLSGANLYRGFVWSRERLP